MQRVAKAIILRRIAYGEADWIVSFLDRDGGRMSGIAKSARSSLRRFGGALEPGTVVELRFFVRPGGGLARLEEAKVLRTAIGTTKSLGRIQALARALELALAFVPEGQPAPEKYALLESRLMAIAGGEPTAAESVRYEIEWLRLCGFGPLLSGCGLCGAEAKRGGRWSFDFDRGGILCGSCVTGSGQRIKLTGGSLEGLLALEGQRSPDGERAEAAGAVIARYIDHVLGRPLRQWTV